MKPCDDFHDDFELYALGVLDPAEKTAIDDHLREAGIDFSYTNVFWGGRSEIKPSEIAPAAYREATENGMVRGVNRTHCRVDAVQNQELDRINRIDRM